MRHALEIVTTAMMRVTNFDTESAIDVDLNVALALVECFSALVKGKSRSSVTRLSKDESTNTSMNKQRLRIMQYRFQILVH